MAKKKFENSEVIIGRVYQHDLKIKKVQDQSSANYGKDYINGKLSIAVDEEGMNVIDVHYTYVAPTYKSGKDSPSFKALKKIIEGGKTWVADGKDEAIKVKATPNIDLNEFDVEENGETRHVAAKVNEGGFIEIVTALPEENERTQFKADMLITKVKRVEENIEKEIPEYVNVHGAIFNFRGALLPVDFTVKNAAGMDYFEGLDASSKNPIFTKIWGKLDSTVVIKKITEESAFGEAAVRQTKSGRKEWIITGTAKIPYDFGDESVLTEEDVKKKMQDREVYLAEQRKKREEYLASKNQAQAGATITSDVAASDIVITNGDFKF